MDKDYCETCETYTMRFYGNKGLMEMWQCPVCESEKEVGEIPTMKIQYNDTPAYIVFDQYQANNNTAMMIYSEENHDLITVASTNTRYIHPEGHVFIKNWTENTGVDKILVDNNVIQKEPIAYTPSGMVNIPIYELTEEARRIWAKATQS